VELVSIAFYVFSTLMIASAVAVIFAKNPVHSVLFLIFAFFNSAGLFIILGAEFVAMLMVIVYVGAVAVLFLFVVMMLNINFSELREGFMRNLPFGILVAALVLVELILVLRVSEHLPASESLEVSAPILRHVTNTEALGAILYTEYVYIFELAGLVLLVAMIGAIVLTQRVREGVRRQNITKQVWRRREDCVEVVKVQSGKGV